MSLAPARLALLTVAASLGLTAQSTIFVSRHAERQAPEPDPPLTQAGERQAEALARLLASANVTRIFTTELMRTRQTAAPTAQRARVEPVIMPQNDFDGLIRRIRGGLQPSESTLVVGHRGTAPRIVKALTGKEVEPLTASEYGRLVAVTLFPDGRSSIVTLRYGE